MKKYKDIERLKDKYAPAFKVGEHITITEQSCQCLWQVAKI